MKIKLYSNAILLSVFICIPLSSANGATVSDFDDGTLQGWSAADPYNLGSFNGVLSVSNSGGNPGGYMVAQDTVSGGGSLAVLAPSQLTGDLTRFGSLSWDVLLPAGSIQSTSILLEGVDGSLFRSDNSLLGNHPINSWFSKSVDFNTETGWQLVSGSATFASVATNTSALYIELEVTTSLGTEAGVDNISAVPIPAAVWLFLSSLGVLFGVATRGRRLSKSA